MKSPRKTLFVCAFGQSRSRYFAEQEMLKGNISLFCGYDEEADIKINKKLIEWADRVVILDKHAIQEPLIRFLDIPTFGELIWFYIDDEPSLFKHRYKEFKENFK